MEITREQVLALGTCAGFREWYEGNEETDALKLLLQVNDEEPTWASWGLAHAMNNNQRVRIAIYCAELVLDIYEEWEESTDILRKAIESVKVWLDNPTRITACAVYDADAAAESATLDILRATNRASVCDAVWAAACTIESTIRTAAYATTNTDPYAADSAADSAAGAANFAARAMNVFRPARKETQEKIIREAVRILEESDGK